MDQSALLAQTVRRFPCLWNHNLAEQQSPGCLALAWEQVAEIVGSGLTAMQCQAQWRMLRNNYTAHLQRGLAAETYLNGAMEFTRPLSGDDDSSSDSELVEEATTESIHDQVTTSGYYEEDNSNLDYDTSNFEYNNYDHAPAACQHVRIGSSDGDALFLLSMLREMEAMNEEQKQTFKNTVLALSEQFLN